jgi:flagellar protein FlaJ
MNLELRKNLEKMKSLALEIENVQNEMQKAKNEEKKLMSDFIDNAKNELKRLSGEIPGFLAEKKKTDGIIGLKGAERRKYLTETGIDEDALTVARKKIEKRKITEIEKAGKETYTMPGIFTKLSSRLFSSPALKITKSALFKGINKSLRKANMPYLISTYISIALLISLISLFFSIVAAIALFPVIGYFSILIAIGVPLIVFIVILVYPSSEISSIKNKIDDELPFATMHMSAISSSGVEPSKVFSILAASPEYPAIRKEMRKIANMINFYGYDLTTALRTTAKTTSSERLAELLNGISSTISGGGELRSYLDKIAADSLLDYKLRRKRFTAISETYADIYTGLLIAAPLMFMLILILMNVITGNIAGMSTTTVAAIGIGAIVLLNIGFLIFLEISQPAS